MDTNPPFPAGSDYAGLKDELQKIAGIIEQYPDQLKQRAFDLLINAYLGRSSPVETPAAAPADNLVEESVPAAAVSGQEIEMPPTVETVEEHIPLDIYASRLEPESTLGTADDTAANLLRKRIRLRTMSPVRWQTQSPV